MYRVTDQVRLLAAAQRILTGTGVVTATVVFSFIFAAATFGVISPADALPSYARQTGQPCGTCHTDFPGLTPYGRRFKIGGYTAGGGPYRTTLFSDSLRKRKSDAAAKSDTAKDGPQDTGDTWVPPIAMMAIVGYTHTQAAQTPPCGGPYSCNDQFVASPVSFFYGGAITDHLGAFAQVTYGGAPFGAPYNDCVNAQAVNNGCDPYETFQWSWDNTDVRYANTATVAGMDVIFGITANNNPTVQDPWNTTPAWAFPYAGSTTAPKPAAATLIDQGLGPGHVVGVGGYALVNDLLYVELTGYRSLNWNTQAKLGIDPFGVGMISGVAPYWRVALEPHWGNHWLEFGAFGMSTRLQQWDPTQMDSNGWQIPAFIPQTDRFTDTAFDAQYQYQGSNYWLTLRGTYIHEDQQLDATFNSQGSSNPSNTLNTFRGLASLAYGEDNRIVLTGQYFDTQGSSDTGLYANNPGCACSPNSNGYIAEIAYIPFISSRAPGWPWANMRVGLQYTYYNKFDGDTVFAHDNNTLFGYIWFAM
jgi:hypothetical protein